MATKEIIKYLKEKLTPRLFLTCVFLGLTVFAVNRYKKSTFFEQNSKAFTATVLKKSCTSYKGGPRMIDIDFEGRFYIISSTAEECRNKVVGDSIELFYHYEKEEFYIPGFYLHQSKRILFMVLFGLALCLLPDIISFFRKAD